MTAVLLIGSDAPLLEGMAQTLAAAGHRPRLAVDAVEARERTPGHPPLVIVAARALAGDALRLPLAPGGALVLYRSGDDLADALPPSVQRAALADLTLPLEWHRLLALVAYVEERAARTGRARPDTPPEHRAL
jgi:DNA-binding NtrC family response regulator